jgi:hypothetical protein
MLRPAGYAWRLVLRSSSERGRDLITYLAFRDKNRALSFEKYLKSHSGIAFAKKRLW